MNVSSPGISAWGHNHPGVVAAYMMVIDHIYKRLGHQTVAKPQLTTVTGTTTVRLKDQCSCSCYPINYAEEEVSGWRDTDTPVIT